MIAESMRAKSEKQKMPQRRERGARQKQEVGSEVIRHQNKHMRTREREREREQEVGQFATGHSVAKINSSVKKKNRQEEEDEEKREREGHRSRRRVQNKPK